MDQYLYPYYRRDVELNQTYWIAEHAIEMLPSCWLKLLGSEQIRSGSTLKSLCGESPLLSERLHWRAKSG